jgi:hypothetical protein
VCPDAVGCELLADPALFGTKETYPVRVLVNFLRFGREGERVEWKGEE